jgi:hypothetical protein
MSKLQTRRQFIRKAGYMAAGLAFLGCGGNSGDTATGGDAATCGDAVTGGDAATDGGAPVWSRIPMQSWIVGVPVYIDLKDYVTDPDGDALTISLDKALPEGVTLNGSVISGTPTAVTASALYVATADDGSG